MKVRYSNSIWKYQLKNKRACSTNKKYGITFEQVSLCFIAIPSSCRGRQSDYKWSPVNDICPRVILKRGGAWIDLLPVICLVLPMNLIWIVTFRKV